MGPQKTRKNTEVTGSKKKTAGKKLLCVTCGENDLMVLMVLLSVPFRCFPWTKLIFQRLLEISYQIIDVLHPHRHSNHSRRHAGR